MNNIHIAKRSELMGKQIMMLRLFSVFCAIVVGGIFILCLGKNPISVYARLVSGAFRSQLAFRSTVKIMIPLLISALGITLAFKMKFWNIGAEGQIIFGGIFSAYFALFYSGLPHFLLMIIMFLAGFLGGGLWGAIPAFFKSKYNTNETLFTLMLNYIALYVIVFLRDGSWADPQSGGFPKIARFAENSQIGPIFGIQAGWVIALILVVLVFVYLKFTKFGYEISVVGESESTALYAGMDVKKITLRTMFLSGGICGVAGMIQSSGSDMTLTTSVAGGVGFTAIIVAWLANLDSFGILLVSFLFAILEKGSGVIETDFGISTYSADVLQGLLLFVVLAGEFFIRYRFQTNKKSSNAAVAKEEKKS